MKRKEFTPAPVIDAAIIEQIEGGRPPFPPDLLSRAEKDRLIQRGFHGLYRGYTDRSFDWRAFGQGHSPELLAIVEG